MTASDFFGRPPSDADETATERRLRSFRPRPPRFTAEAILAAFPPEPACDEQPAPFRRRLVLAVAAAWLGGMITGAAALHLLRGPTVDLQVADASNAATPPPALVEIVVPETSGSTDTPESPQLLPEQRLGRGAATRDTSLADPWSVHLIAANPDQVLRDYGLRAGSPLRVRPRSDQRLTPSETEATVESRSPPASRQIEQREPLTPTSYRQWPAADFDRLMRDLQG